MLFKEGLQWVHGIRLAHSNRRLSNLEIAQILHVFQILLGKL